jgi:hypothetical protein
VAEHWNQAEQAAAEALIQRLQSSDAPSLSVEWVADALDNLNASGDETVFIAALATGLGDASARSLDRVRRVYHAHGPEALCEAARNLLDEPHATVAMRFQFLEFRAKTAREYANV